MNWRQILFKFYLTEYEKGSIKAKRSYTKRGKRKGSGKSSRRCNEKA